MDNNILPLEKISDTIVEQLPPWKVLVRTDDAGRVVDINSNAFVQDTDGWVQIDSGSGDRYHHAQGNYLPGPLTDERGLYRYKLTDGAVVERTAEEMDGDWAPIGTEHDPLEALQEENTLLRAHVKALADRGEFLEDCIAEMAMVVYAE